jgi:hypothetical protein
MRQLGAGTVIASEVSLEEDASDRACRLRGCGHAKSAAAPDTIDDRDNYRLTTKAWPRASTATATP